MDPGLFDELDDLGADGAASQARGPDAQEREWEEFVRRRDAEARSKREEREARLREKEAEEQDRKAAQQEDWMTSRRIGAPALIAPNRQEDWTTRRRTAAPEPRLQPPATASPSDRQALRERAQDDLSRQRRAPTGVAKPQQLEPNVPADDPFADFCRRVRTANVMERENDNRMAELRERRDASDALSDAENASEPEEVAQQQKEQGRGEEGGLPSMRELLKSIGKEERNELPRALRRLLAEIDEADKEDREFEALRPLLPDLEHAGQRSCDVLATPADDSNPLLKLAVRYMQEQREDINFQELYLAHAETVLQAGTHVESEEGSLAAREHAQQHLLVEERAWMEERRELRRSQWEAAREAAEASGRSALSAAPKNTKISSSSTASSSSAWLGGAAPQPYSAFSEHPGGRAASSSAAWLGEAEPPPLLQVPPGRRGAAAHGKGRPAAGQAADPGAQRRVAPPRRQAQPELTLARQQQLEQARQRDEQVRLQSFREAWRRRRGAAPESEPTELD